MFNATLLKPHNIAVIVLIVLIWRFASTKIFAWLDRSGNSDNS